MRVWFRSFHENLISFLINLQVDRDSQGGEMRIAIEFIWFEHFHWYVMNNIWNDMHPILLKRFSASVLSLTTSIVGKLQRQQWWPMEAMDRRPFCYRMRKSNVKLWLMICPWLHLRIQIWQKRRHCYARQCTQKAVSEMLQMQHVQIREWSQMDSNTSSPISSDSKAIQVLHLQVYKTLQHPQCTQATHVGSANLAHVKLE